MTEQKGPVDALGLAPYGEAVKVVAQGVVNGAGAFLGRICLPAAQELGLLFQDKVSQWRQANAARVIEGAERLLPEDAASELHAHPRLVMQIVKDGSWTESDEVQELWSGLLASSCTPRGDDDSNLIFIDLLNQMTRSQCRLLRHLCENSPAVYKGRGGWLTASSVTMPFAALKLVMGLEDPHVIDREVDHMSSLGIFTPDSGLNLHGDVCFLRLTTLALQLYARARGHRGDVEDFYTLSSASSDDFE